MYCLLVGDCFGKYKFLGHMLDNFCHKNPLLANNAQCPACPKVDV